mgnify:FL=1
MTQGCRSSGLITADTLVHSGRCKLVSFHGYNNHATASCTVKIYDNTAASGTQVAEIILPPHISSVMDDTSGGDQDATQNTTVQIEADYHGVICTNGIYVDVNGGTPRLTVEFA